MAKIRDILLMAVVALTLLCSCHSLSKVLKSSDRDYKLEVAKQEFVPDDGVILATVKVPFAQGETAFDTLVRACQAYEIQLEYSWTPLYDSYYIEGINHIYEFDCGSESGWMYKVDGWSPNYGCSSFVLQGGENIVWCYTCVGLGVDVGGSGW